MTAEDDRSQNVKGKKGCHSPRKRDIEKRGKFKPGHKNKTNAFKMRPPCHAAHMSQWLGRRK
jgi:hypothetical protein